MMGCRPYLHIQSDGEGSRRLYRHGKADVLSESPFKVLETALSDVELPPSDERFPLGGAVGYIGYEAAKAFQDFNWISHQTKIPDVQFGLYDVVYVLDHDSKRIQKVMVSICPDTEGVARELDAISASYKPTFMAGFQVGEPKVDLNYAEYESAINSVLEYIRKGDIYQVNYSYKVTAPFSGSHRALYDRLRDASPAPYSSFLSFDDVSVFSSSPECFVDIRDREIKTYPIKGTVSRGVSESVDEDNKAYLMSSKKDAAELLMIVDLERNDLARVCEPGSVSVPELKRLETYAQVHHLVSTVQGKLASQYSHLDAVLTMFPGGSITGAPKIRAMEIIDEIEKGPRSVYTGVIGCFGFNHITQFNIAIRTIYAHNGVLSFHIGSGVVVDSTPEKEWEETRVKAKGMLEALMIGGW
jgi:para-aminobenzoate synthetase component 1